MKKRTLFFLILTTVLAVVYAKIYHAEDIVADLLFYRTDDFPLYGIAGVNIVLGSFAILRSLSVFDYLMADRIESVSFLSMLVVRSSLQESILFQFKELLKKSGILYGLLWITIVVSQFIFFGKVNDLLLISIHLVRYTGIPFLISFVQIMLAICGKDTKTTIVLSAVYYVLFTTDILFGICMITVTRTVYIEVIYVMINLLMIIVSVSGCEKMIERKGDIL